MAGLGDREVEPVPVDTGHGCGGRGAARAEDAADEQHGVVEVGVEGADEIRDDRADGRIQRLVVLAIILSVADRRHGRQA